MGSIKVNMDTSSDEEMDCEHREIICRLLDYEHKRLPDHPCIRVYDKHVVVVTNRLRTQLGYYATGTGFRFYR